MVQKKKFEYKWIILVLCFGICLQGANSAHMKHLKEVEKSPEFRTMIQRLFLLLLTGSKPVEVATTICGWKIPNNEKRHWNAKVPMSFFVKEGCYMTAVVL